jgi:uncharacterized membrane protein YkoI
MRYVICGVVAVGLGAALAGAGLVRGEDDDGEEEVAIADLPQAVVDAIKKDYPNAELLAAEKETENGETLYDVEFKNDGKTLEAEVTPDGKIVEVEEEDDDDDDDGDDEAEVRAE